MWIDVGGVVCLCKESGNKPGTNVVHLVGLPVQTRGAAAGSGDGGEHAAVGRTRSDREASRRTVGVIATEKGLPRGGGRGGGGGGAKRQTPLETLIPLFKGFVHKSY